MTRSIAKIGALLLTLVLLLGCVPAALADGGDSSPVPETAGASGAPASETGLIDAAALDAWMDDYVALNGLGGEYQRFSVGFCYTGTGDCWFYRGDDWMYSASLYKVPVSMLMAEKEAAGELAPDTVITNQYGTGTLEKLESTALVLSNNDSGHIMVEYLGGTYNGKCADQTVRFTPLEESYFSEEDFSDLSYYTARYMTYVMKTLLEGGDETFPHVEEYLKQAQPGEYFNTDPTLSGYGVAQKYGAFVEQNGNNNNHSAAIIYTPTPIIVVVMTRNVGDYQHRMGEVGAHLAELALQLDEKKAALEREEEALARAEAEAHAAAAAPEAESLPFAAPDAGTGTEPSPTPEPEAEPGAEPAQLPESARTFPVWIVAVLAAVLIAASVAVAGRRASRRKRRRPVKTRSDGQTPPSDTDGYRPRH